MFDLNRRTFLSLLAGAALAKSPLFAQEQAAAPAQDGWRSRSIALLPEDRQEKPPVVTAVRLQPAGHQLATAGDDHLVWVWNFETGEPIHKLDAHADWVRTIDYSPDGRTLATAGNDRQIIFWDAAKGEKLQVFATHKEAITMLAFAHDGARLATVGFDDRLRIHDAGTGRVTRELTCSCRDMRAVAWSPDDARLVAGGRDGKLRVWNTATGELEQEQSAHKQRIRTVVFSPDGKHIASSGEDRVVRVWKLDGGDQGFVLPDRSAKVLAIAFVSPDVLATAGTDNLVRLWDLASRTEIAKLAGHVGSVAALIARDGMLVSGSFDTTVRVWTSERSVTKLGRRPSAGPAFDTK